MKYSIEVQENGRGKNSWEEDLKLDVPYIADSARRVAHTKYEHPVEAAMATMDFWNATLRADEKPRQVIKVFEEDKEAGKKAIWSGCYPAVVVAK